MNILQSLVNDAKKKKDELVNNIANIGQAPHPVNTAPQQVVQKIQNAKYGVLANPQNQQTAIRQLQAPVIPRPSIARGLSNAGEAVNQTTMHNIVQPFIARPAMEVAQTVRQQVTHKPSTYTPGSPMARELFGNTPVASIQKKVSDQYSRQSTSSNPLLRIASRPLAAGEGILSVANDIPVVGGVAKVGMKGLEKVAPKALPAAKILAKDAQAGVKAAQARVGTNEAVTAQQKQLQREITSHQKQINGLPIDNHKAAEVLQRKIDTKQGMMANLEASRPQQNIIQKGADRVLSAQPGLGIKAVNPELPKRPVPNVTHDTPPNLSEVNDRFKALRPDVIQQHGEIKSIAPNKSTNNMGWDVQFSNGFTAKDVTIPSKLPKALSAENQKIVNSRLTQNPTAPVKSTKPATAQLKSSGKAPLPASTETSAVSLPNDTPKVVQNGFTMGAKQGRQSISDDLAKKVQGEHIQRNTAAMGEAASQDVNKLKLPDAVNVAHEKLAVPLGSASDADHAFVIRAIERADEAAARAKNAGDMQAYETYRRESSGLHDSLSEHLTAKGQGGQIAALLYSKTPQGMYYKAEKVLKQAGQFDEKKGAELQNMVDKIKAAKDDATKQQLTAEFHKKVSDHLPQSLARNLLGVWKAGLLSGTKTIAGNPLSNETLYAMKEASDPASVAFDKALKVAGKTNIGKKLGLTGERTYTTSHTGIVSGTKEGFGGLKTTLKTGIDKRDIQAKVYENSREINFKNKVVQNFLGKPSNSVFRIMSGADQPVFFRTLKQELGRQAKVDAINQGITGKERTLFIQKAMQNPTKETMQVATDAAWKSVLGQDTKLGSALSQFTQKIPAAQAVIPFTKVPTNFISRTLDYTPVGAVKGLAQAAVRVQKGQGIDQRALAQALGEATTGSSLLFIGKTLADKGLVSGQYPSDPKEQQRWKVNQIQPNSVHVGNKWISLNYLGPLGLIFGAGKDYHDASSKGNNGASAALLGAGKNLTGQSFLSGFSGLSNAINDPAQSAGSYINSQVASGAPSWLNDIANVSDNFQRQADNPIEALKNRVPGAREQNNVKQDVYGNPLAQADGRPNTINPLKPSNDLSKKNDVVSEVNRLHNVDPNNKDLQVTPTPIDKALKIEGITVKLSSKQRYDLQKQIGQATQSKWGQLIKTPEYKAMSDTDKAKALNGLRTDSALLETRKYVTDNNLGTFSKAATANVQKLAGGDLSSYLSASDGTGLKLQKGISSNSASFLKSYNNLTTDERKQKEYSQNDYEYKTLVAKFENDQKAGTLTKKQVIDRKNAIDRALVGKDYSKDTRDLYSLNKTDLGDWLRTQEPGIDKQRLGEELLAYDQALHNAGLTTTLKFKYGFGTASGGSSSKSSGSSGGSRAKLTPSDFKTPYDNIIKSAAKGASLARNAKLAKKA